MLINCSGTLVLIKRMSLHKKAPPLLTKGGRLNFYIASTATISLLMGRLGLASLLGRVVQVPKLSHRRCHIADCYIPLTTITDSPFKMYWGGVFVLIMYSVLLYHAFILSTTLRHKNLINNNNNKQCYLDYLVGCTHTILSNIPVF